VSAVLMLMIRHLIEETLMLLLLKVFLKEN